MNFFECIKLARQLYPIDRKTGIQFIDLLLIEFYDIFIVTHIYIYVILSIFITFLSISPEPLKPLNRLRSKFLTILKRFKSVQCLTPVE